MAPTAISVEPAVDCANGNAEHEPSEALAHILDNPHLPTPPAVALQIIDKARRPDCSPKELVKLLSQDPGLCGKLLQNVNSSAYGQTRPVTSLERAVMVVGVKPLRSLVLGWSLSAIDLPAGDEVVGRFWQESVAGAVVARELAIRLNRPDPEDDLVAGLLRDLGALVLRQVFTEEYATIAADPSFSAAELCAAETAAFGLDHCEVGAGLLYDWRLPADLVEPIRHHHHPERLDGAPAAQRDRAWLLSFASDLARLKNGIPHKIGPLVQTARTRFDMDPAALAKFLGAVLPRINEFAALMKVDIGKCPDFAAIVAAGCKELVSLTSNNAPAPPPGADPIGSVPEMHASKAMERTACFVSPNPDATVVSNGERSPATLPDFDFSCLNHLPPGGTRLNGYEVRSAIGRGAMGIVYKAFDPLLSRYVAIKMLTPERVVVSDARERFMREARAAAAIQHENVITIYAVAEANCMSYLVMEFVEGMSLQDRLDRSETLAMPIIVNYARQIAAGLRAAHARGVVHRDIKPANILVSKESGTVKITDFGLARLRDAAMLTQEGNWVGTPAFMAPEQFRSAKVDHRADLFALGSVLYTLCAGVTPFSAESMMVLMRQICEDTPKPLRQVRADVPPWLEQLIAKLHAKDPEQRPASANEVVQTVERHLFAQ